MKTEQKEKTSQNITTAGVHADINDITPEPNMVITGPNSGSSSWSMDDIIPADLKAARAALPKDEDDEEEEIKGQDELQILDEEDDKELLPPSRESKQRDEEDEEEGVALAEEDEDDDDDLDLSPDSIDELLKGDADAPKAKKELENKIKAGEEKFWKADKEYKNLISRLPFGGVRVEDLDEFIQTTLDKRVVDNTELLNTLESEKVQLEAKREADQAEIQRLRQVERSTRFDALPETHENYIKPMQEAGKNAKKILELEGISTTNVHQLFLAKDRAHFNKLLENEDISDDAKQKLVNHWKDYKKILFEYENDKKEAQLNLSKFLQTNIAPETANKVLRNSLVELLEKNPKYQPLAEAINDDISKHPGMSKVVESARNSFMNFVSVLSDPSSAVHDENWMNGLAKFIYDASFNQQVYNDYTELQQQHQATQEQLKKMVKAHRKLLKSAKGITGAKGTPARMVRNGNGSLPERDKAAKQFEDFISGRVEVDDLLA